MATHGDIGVSQPADSTITFKVATVALTRNSSVQHQELLTLADPETTNALARVTDTTPDSTMHGLVVRVAAPSTGPFAISSIGGAVVVRSSAADMNVTAVQGGTWNVGTVTAVSSLAGVVRIAGNNATDGLVHVGDSTNNALRVNVVAGAAAGSTEVTVRQSTNTDLVARVFQGPGNSSAADRWRVNVANSSASDYLPVRLVDSSGTGYLSPGLEYTDGSTTSTLAGPGLLFNNSSNNTMRLVGIAQPLPVQVVKATPSLLSTTVIVTSSNSTALYELLSSAAGVRHKVYGYFVASTATAPSTVIFLSSAAIDRWPVVFGSGSSGVTGANGFVTPPAWIFATETANALNVRVECASTGQQTRIGISYFTEA